MMFVDYDILMCVGYVISNKSHKQQASQATNIISDIVAYAICCLCQIDMFVAYDICLIIRVVPYDVCRLI